MAQRKFNSAQQYATGTGTGDLTLGVATSLLYRTFQDAGINDGDTTYVRIQHETILNEWEDVLVSYNAGVITRIFDSRSSSPTGALINFSAGNKRVSSAILADQVVTMNTDGIVTDPVTFQNTLTLASVNAATNASLLINGGATSGSSLITMTGSAASIDLKGAAGGALVANGSSFGLLAATNVPLFISSQGTASIDVYTGAGLRAQFTNGGLHVEGAVNIDAGTGTVYAFQSAQALTGTVGGPTGFNTFNITSDDINGGNFFVDHFAFDGTIGGASMQGGRQNVVSYLRYVTGSNAASTNRNYASLVGWASAEASDGGTALNITDSKGGLFGGNSGAWLKPGSTNWLNLTAHEFNVTIDAGASVYIKTLIQLSNNFDDAVKGTGIDAMSWWSRQGIAATTWTTGLLFGHPDDVNAYPFDSSSTLLKSLAGELWAGIDFNDVNILGYAFRSPNFTISGTGNVNMGLALQTGLGANMEDTSIEIGAFRTGSGNSYIDFHADNSSDYNLRLIRYSGTNGGAQIQNAGTGGLGLIANTIQLDAQSAGGLYFTIDSEWRLVVGATGASVLGTFNIVPPAGNLRGLNVEQNVTGTIAGPTPLNLIHIVSDDINGDYPSGLDHFVDGFQVWHEAGGSAQRGGRQAIAGLFELIAPTAADNNNRNYVGGAFTAIAKTSDTGTNTTYAGSRGAVFGAFAVGVLESAAQNMLNVTGMELDVAMFSGSSSYAKSLLLIANRQDDIEKGSVIDAMIWAFKQDVPTVPTWDYGILFDCPDVGFNSFPFTTTSTVFKVGTGDIGTGFDLSQTTITDYAFRSPGFSVDGTGFALPARLQISGNRSASSWTTTGISFAASAATYTDTSGSGTIASRVANSLATPTFDSSSSVTLTDAATLYIQSAPAAGSNTTITNAYSLWVDSGTVRIDEGIYLPATGVGIGVAPGLASLRIGYSFTRTSWTVQGTAIRVDAATYTDSNGTGTIGTRAVNSFGIATLASSSAVTLTNGATVYIDGPPAAGTNTTITSSWALMAAAGSIYVAAGSVYVTSAGVFSWAGRSRLLSPADGVVTLGNAANTDFARLQLGGTSSSFPSIKRQGAGIDFRLGDDSAYTLITASSLGLAGSVGIGINMTGSYSSNAIDLANITSVTNAQIRLKNSTPGIKARNAANDADHDILYYNTSNVIILGGSSGSALWAASTFTAAQTFRVGGSAVSRNSWTTSGVNFAATSATFTDLTGSGTIANRAANSFDIPTFASTSSVTVTDAATLYIAGVPVAGTNTTITNAWSLHVVGASLFSNNMTLGGSNLLIFQTRSTIRSGANGNVMVANNAGTDFGLLQLGGSTSSFPALKRSTTTIQVRLADDSAFAGLDSALHTITSASSTSLTVGPNGATNPVLQIDASTASQAAGFKITGATSAGTVALAVVSSGADTNLSINAKGTGVISIGDVSTGSVTVYRPLIIGAVEISTDSNGAFQLGGVNKTPYIDWNSYNGTPNDYDVRMIVEGGSASTNGAGTYTVWAALSNFTGHMVIGADKVLGFSGRSYFSSTSDGTMLVTNNAVTDFNRLQFGGTTSSFPSLKRSGTGLLVRLADDSADAPITARNLYLNAPNTQTGATYTVVDTDNYIIGNRAGTITLTLPAASSYLGRAIMIKTIQAQAIISASSNVIPRIGGSPGAAIVPGTDGAWSLIVSNGTDWEIMAGGL